MKTFIFTLVLLLGCQPAFAQSAPSDPMAAMRALEKPPVKGQTEYLSYSWPYADKDIEKDLGEAPIVVELFSTQACLFCPVADKFFNDLTQHVPAVIGLSCHVDYLDVKEGSLSQQACTKRQYDYAASIPGGSVYTPQIIINGQRETFGFRYGEIYDLMQQATKAPPVKLSIEKRDGATYVVKMPSLKEKRSAENKLSLKIFQYHKPADRAINEGPNQFVEMHYTRVVAGVSDYEWPTGKTEFPVTVTPSPDAAGAVFVLQDEARIWAAGEIKF